MPKEVRFGLPAATLAALLGLGLPSAAETPVDPISNMRDALAWPELLSGRPVAAIIGRVRAAFGPGSYPHAVVTLLALRLERRSAEAHIEDKAKEGFLAEVAANRTPAPAAIVDGIATVDVSNTAIDPATGVMHSVFAFPDKPRDNVVRSGDSRVAELLNTWFREGTAAGNVGDLYDNRDRGHSPFPADAFPQMARVRYVDAVQKAGVDRGLWAPIIFNATTLGNASLAVTSGAWRSLPRQAMTAGAGGMMPLYLGYVSNQIHVYPEHMDHDAKLGDLLTANTPYYVISQGSSGSDQPFLFTLASILAAFRPDTKAFLVEKGLIAPTVQWIFRRGQHGIDSDEDYLSGKAHISVFQKEALDVAAMITRAHELKRDEVPPMVRLKVVDESQGDPASGVFAQGGEFLFDTPSAISRVIRSTDYFKRLVVDAGETADPNGRPLTFRWVVLGGDDRIVIKPLNESGSKAEIIVPWQERRTLTDWPIIQTDRVDIGVFASNGKNWSAPAFISFLYPGNEKRVYRPDRQIAEIDYAPAEFKDRYVDPLLFPARDWRDTFRYDGEGRLIGWDRTRGASVEHFTRDGARIVETDAGGRPVKAETVRYEVRPLAEDRLEVEEVPMGEFVDRTN